MWWFSSQKEPSVTLRKVQERLESLERQVNTLDLEWSDTYDKLKHIVGRIVKRSAILQSQTDRTDEPEAVAPAPAPMSPEKAFALAQIAKRRGLG